MLGSLRISSKLMIMVGLAIVSVLAVAFVSLSALRHNLLEDRKAKLQDLVEVAREAVQNDYEVSKKAGLSDEDAKERTRVLIRRMHFGTDYFYATSSDVTTQAHPNPKVEGKNMADFKDPDGVLFARQQVDIVHSQGSGFVAYRFPKAGGDTPMAKISYQVAFKPYDWIIGSGIYIDDVDAIFFKQLMQIGALIAVGLFIVIGASLLLTRSIVKPIAGMTQAMRKLAAGDTAAEVPARDRGDEVGAMAQSVQVFKDNMIETARLRGEQDALKQTAESERKQLLSRTADEFQSGVRASLDALTRSADVMRTMSQDMSSTAKDASNQAATVAVAAGEATTNVQTVAAATEELSSSVTEIGRQVSQSTQIAAKAVAEANRTNMTVQGLSNAAQKIGDVVRLISDIAEQTNLLALNATIEAARAGEAGRGFAVVANEVKSLATQTAKATEEIAAQVAAMQGATTEAVQAIESIGGTISAINEIAATIASAVEEQGAATQEIARNVQQAAQGTGVVSHTIVGVNQAASQTGSAAENVLASAEELSRQSDTLRADVDSFLARIRAA
ncbi:MAG: cache domain-containing protein [Xanthobacteraceae bacterium]|nr:cache domain-containing protein [Xanthobacteraceae bacterium]